jgi:hypothetical protein
MNAKITSKAGERECTAPEGAAAGALVAPRLRIWETASMFHCSVLGTCLPLSQLHDIARRARYGLPPRASAYEVHTYFVKSLGSCNTLSKLVDKALEKRHEGAARTVGARATNRSSRRAGRKRWKAETSPGPTGRS